MKTDIMKVKSATKEELLKELSEIEYELSTNGGMDISYAREKDLYAHQQNILNELNTR